MRTAERILFTPALRQKENLGEIKYASRSPQIPAARHRHVAAAPGRRKTLKHTRQARKERLLKCPPNINIRSRNNSHSRQTQAPASLRAQKAHDEKPRRVDADGRAPATEWDDGAGEPVGERRRLQRGRKRTSSRETDSQAWHGWGVGWWDGGSRDGDGAQCVDDRA